MSYIEPVSLPSAAGINFGEGDVRHFSEGDGVNVPGISNPTRQLAARDSLLADKINDIAAEVNNKEQIVPLQFPRMTLPPSSEEIIANHRIPQGYEARVLNAAISSTPLSSDIELDVMWSTGYGNVSGTSIVSTSAETQGGTTFSGAGEFIISAKNKGSITLDIAASIMLTMRPVANVQGALLPSIVVVPPGPPGQQGIPGQKGGDGGVGPPGSPGLVYHGNWVDAPPPIVYNINDVVTHDFAGTSGASSYVCLQAHTSNGINEPNPTLMPSPFWNFTAKAGVSAPFTFLGTWTAGVSYGVNNLVNYTTGGITSTYICVLANVSAAGKEPTNTTYWSIFASAPSTTVPNYGTQIVFGTLIPDPVNFVFSSAYSGSNFAAGGTYFIPLRETFVESATANPGFSRGYATLAGVIRSSWSGTAIFTLPAQASIPPTKGNWGADYAQVLVTPHGILKALTNFITNGTNTTNTTYSTGGTNVSSITVPNTITPTTEVDIATVKVSTIYPFSFQVVAQNASPIMMEISVAGHTVY